jgi:hypothetical protein
MKLTRPHSDFAGTVIIVGRYDTDSLLEESLARKSVRVRRKDSLV